MKDWLYALAGTFLGLGGGIVFSQCISSYVGLWLMGIGILIFVCLFLYEWSKKVWPNRDKWIAEFRHNGKIERTLDLQNTISKDKRLHWISSEPQKKEIPLE